MKKLTEFIVEFNKNVIPETKGLNLREDGRPKYQVEFSYPFKINGFENFIYAGMITDFASIPRIFWNIFLPYDPSHAWPALIHDMIYQGHLYPKDMADKIFLAALQFNGNSMVKCFTMYQAVNIFGHRAYNRVKPEKIAEVRQALGFDVKSKYVFED